jgi:hypothetical protein
MLHEQGFAATSEPATVKTADGGRDTTSLPHKTVATILRPPLANDRLHILPDQNVQLECGPQVGCRQLHDFLGCGQIAEVVPGRVSIVQNQHQCSIRTVSLAPECWQFRRGKYRQCACCPV